MSHPWTKPSLDIYSAEEVAQLFGLEKSMKRADVIAWSEEYLDPDLPSVLAWNITIDSLDEIPILK